MDKKIIIASVVEAANELEDNGFTNLANRLTDIAKKISFDFNNPEKEMKVNDLYLNQGKMVEGFRMRTELSQLVESSGCEELSSLGVILLDKYWTPSDLEMDLGSSAMEALLDEIENADHNKIASIHGKLKEEEVL